MDRRYLVVAFLLAFFGCSIIFNVNFVNAEVQAGAGVWNGFVVETPNQGENYVTTTATLPYTPITGYIVLSEWEAGNYLVSLAEVGDKHFQIGSCEYRWYSNGRWSSWFPIQCEHLLNGSKFNISGGTTINIRYEVLPMEPLATYVFRAQALNMDGNPDFDRSAFSYLHVGHQQFLPLMAK